MSRSSSVIGWGVDENTVPVPISGVSATPGGIGADLQIPAMGLLVAVSRIRNRPQRTTGSGLRTLEPAPEQDATASANQRR